MKESKSKTIQAKKLRKAAEDALAKRKAADIKKLSGPEVKKLVHEIEVHQIELEMQNEELSRTQAEAEKARDKYEDLYDFSPVGYLTLDEKGDILEANLMASSLFKAEKVHFIKRKFPLFVASGYRNAFHAFLKQVFASDTKQVCEIKLVDNDGQPFYAQLESIQMGNTEEGPKLCQTAVIDISELKKKDETEALKKRMEFILGATKTGLDIIDSEFNLRYVDPGWQKVYGDYKGKRCFEYFMGRSERCSSCGIPRALETKQPVITEEALAREGNRVVQVTTLPFQDGKGGWLVAEVNVDITERKKLEMELEKHQRHLEDLVKERTAAFEVSETRFRRLFEAAKEGILILDAATGTIIEVNPFLIEVLGYSREELLGKELWEIGLLRDIIASKESFLELQSKEYIRYDDLPLRTKDGHKIGVEFISNVYTVNHEKVVQCSIRDVTERKQMQDELKEKMQDLERFAKFAVDRELKMEELEKKIKELEERLKDR